MSTKDDIHLLRLKSGCRNISPTEGVSAAASAPPYGSVGFVNLILRPFLTHFYSSTIALIPHSPAGSNYNPNQHSSESGTLDSTIDRGVYPGTRPFDASQHDENLQSAYDVFGQPQTRDTVALQASPAISTNTLGQDAHARWHSNASSIWVSERNYKVICIVLAD